MHLFCQLSNILGFLPVVYCLQNNSLELAAMIATCFVFSIFYHVNEENKIGYFIDLCGCGILTGGLLHTLRESEFTVANVATAIFTMSSFFFYWIASELSTNSNEYAFYHSLWHILTVYAVSTFLYSFHADKEKSKFLCVKIVRKVVEKK